MSKTYFGLEFIDQIFTSLSIKDFVINPPTRIHRRYFKAKLYVNEHFVGDIMGEYNDKDIYASLVDFGSLKRKINDLRWKSNQFRLKLHECVVELVNQIYHEQHPIPNTEYEI